MAQAARLSLRMQKELKLLLTDPPPGVSLPMLSTDLSSTSTLSSFDAQIEGPEGTVYAKGVFNIKIQIPERYPFQPPNVTFATPIYHPNIDNGGRICLDILNLPPKVELLDQGNVNMVPEFLTMPTCQVPMLAVMKMLCQGAWQPSLNISTVLTSIGLLLSEPNPDDGLMCEASREYKYNRQTFDQKARSLTERYAKARASRSSSGGRVTPLNPNPSTMEAEGADLELRNVGTENTSYKKLSGVRRKLSLESLGPSQTKNDDDNEIVPQAHKLSLPQSQILSKACSSKFLPMPQADNYDEQATYQVHIDKAGNDTMSVSSKKLCGTNRKLSLESLSPTKRRSSDGKESMAGFHQSSVSQPKILFLTSSKSLSPLVGSYVEQHSGQAREGKVDNRPPRRNVDDKENMVPFHSHSLSISSSKLSLMRQKINCDVHNGKAVNSGVNISTKKQFEINKIPLCEISGSSHMSSDGDNIESLPHNQHSALHFLSPTSSNSMVLQTGNCDGSQLHQEHGSRKKLSGVSHKLCLGSAVPSARIGFEEKHDVGLVQKSSKSSLMPQVEKADNEHAHKDHVGEAVNGNTKHHVEDDSLINDAVIVLDSEDSEEEMKEPKRSRLSLAQKRLAGKAKYGYKHFA